jgi:hypothetical protein
MKIESLFFFIRPVATGTPLPSGISLAGAKTITANRGTQTTAAESILRRPGSIIFS